MDDTDLEMALAYRPTSYFWAQEHGLPLAPEIQGVERRRMYAQALEAGGAPLPVGLVKPTLSPAERRAWGSIHPAMMGGEYLPPLKKNEVEVARVVLASTMSDVVCVYARPYRGQIQLRIVDEHEGTMLDEPTARTTREPLPLSEFLNFFLAGWNIFEVLAANFEHYGYDRDRVQGFVTSASSSFYPGFDIALRQRVDEWLKEVAPESDEDDREEDADDEVDGEGEH